MLIYNNVTYNTGELIVFSINSTEIEGVLHVEGEYSYVCHNCMEYCGNVSPNMHGYQYSWAFRKVGDSLTDDVKILRKIGEVKENFKIDDNLSNFFSITKLFNISSILPLESVLKDYNEFAKSDIKGLVTMKSNKTNKSIDIKFGRFLKAICNDYKSLKLSDKDIESFYNKYLLYQQGEHFKTIRDIKGNDILKYYKKELQDNKAGTKLLNSCMNDRPDGFLELYTRNNNVSLIAVEQLGLVVGRAFIWTLSDGKKLMDKRYTSYDYIDTLFNNIIVEEGYLNYDTTEDVSVKLEEIEFDIFPYVDTFRFLNKETKTLSNIYKKVEDKQNNIVLDRTDGGFSKR